MKSRDKAFPFFLQTHIHKLLNELYYFFHIIMTVGCKYFYFRTYNKTNKNMKKKFKEQKYELNALLILENLP